MQARALSLADDSYADIAESFRALADTSRVKIVYALLQQELCVCDLATVAGISESATSQHLRILRNLRLVKSRRNGRMIYYSVDDDHVRVLMGVCLRHLGHEPARISDLGVAGQGAQPPGSGESDDDRS